MKPGSSTRKLLEISGAPLCGGNPNVPEVLLRKCSPDLAAEYLKLLEGKNGFFAFESALHAFPAGKATAGYDLENWNRPTGWIADYGDAARDYLFFAEDVFGEQFAIRGDGIYRFDPENGTGTLLTNSIEQWAERILEDYHTETGYKLAHEWQMKNGRLDAKNRLTPKKPFILGGEFDIDNLFALDAERAMRLRADISRQIKDLPPGSQVEIRITE